MSFTNLRLEWSACTVHLFKQAQVVTHWAVALCVKLTANLSGSFLLSRLNLSPLRWLVLPSFCRETLSGDCACLWRTCRWRDGSRCKRAIDRHTASGNVERQTEKQHNDSQLLVSIVNVLKYSIYSNSTNVYSNSNLQYQSALLKKTSRKLWVESGFTFDMKIALAVTMRV